jgi:RNA recognition motif-containing protein
MAVNLFVGNLPYSVDDAKLADLFAAAGTVASAKVIKDKYSGRSRGFGFVEMSTDDESKKAIEMFNGKDMEGRALVVNEARPPKAQ